MLKLNRYHFYLIILIAMAASSTALFMGCGSGGTTETTTSTSGGTTTSTSGGTTTTLPTFIAQKYTYADSVIHDQPQYFYQLHKVGHLVTNEVFEQNDTQEAYMQFDLSSISAGTTIHSANLKLFINNAWPTGITMTIYLYNVSADWGNTTLTWDNRPASVGSAIASKSLNSNYSSTWITIDVTDTVRKWVNGTQTNNGLLIRSLDSTQTNGLTYLTSPEGYRPKLEVDY